LKFVITLVHAPEQCFTRREYKKGYTQWFKHMRESAEKLGIKIQGAYSTPNEHTFYFVLRVMTSNQLPLFSASQCLHTTQQRFLQ
jgi:hypothetical protein